MGCAPVVHAQNIPEIVAREAQRIQEQERQRTREREQNFQQSQFAAPSVTAPEITEEPNIASTGCQDINAVNIVGITRYSANTFSNAANALIGKCITAAKIDGFLRTVTNRYVQDGHITSRALVVADPSKPSTLSIMVVEGQIADVISPPDTNKNAYGSELKTAFPSLKNRLLNLRAIEQGVDQLARLGGSEPQIDIVPGTDAGTSDLIVRRQTTASWLRSSLSINNDGSAQTGRHQATVAMDIDSPLGFADFFSLYYVRDLERRPNRKAEGYGGFFSLPYGYTTLTLSGGRYSYKSILVSNALAFANTGDSINGSIGLDHLLYRDRQTKLSVSATLSLYDTQTRLQGFRLLTNSYRQVAGGIAFRVQHRLKNNSLVQAEIAVTRGFDIFGANAPDIGPGTDGLVFRKIEANAAYQSSLKLFGIPIIYSANIRGQSALDYVLPTERFSIGGSSTVRGFRDDGISGRAGITFRQQMNFGLLTLRPNKGPGQIGGFIGYDAGGIFSRKSDPFERGFLHSAILGLRLSSKRLQSEISIAAPLSAPRSVQYQRTEFAASMRLVF
jgi:hemolysin activation/secretion protein